MAAVRVLFLALFLLGLGCARERSVEKVLPQPNRIAKRHLDGTFLFLKTLVGVKSPGPAYRQYAPGQYLESDKLIQFVIHENQTDVVSIDPLYQQESVAPKNRTLASFPSQNTDIFRKKTPDGDETHEEEETQNRRLWPEREFVKIDFLKDFADSLEKETSTSTVLKGLEYDPVREALNCVVERLLKDGTTLSIRYSFLRYHRSPHYVQRPFPLSEQIQFGLFKTTAFSVNAFDQLSESTRQDFMNRWDTSQTIVFYLSKNFPIHLTETVREIFEDWAEVLRAAVGDPVLVLRPNSGQELGDLRYNIVSYDDSEHSAHGVLGYAPIFTNPRTAQIHKADINLYGRVVKRAIFQELFWEKSRHSTIDEGLSHALSDLKRSTTLDLLAQTTRLNEDVIRKALESSKKSYDPTALETRILADVFAHEFGHGLGLRHNHLAAADKRHFTAGNRSSSIMSYGFIQGTQVSIGSYDKAAILFAYSPHPEVRRKALDENFLFCTDEDVFQSRSPLCQPYTSGSSLTELIEGQLDRYYSNYEINNRRLERLGFGEDLTGYDRRILALLLPLRLAYDNAQALVQATQQKDWPSLWKLTRQRIEVDPLTPQSDYFSINVEMGNRLDFGERGPSASPLKLRRHLDRKKMRAVLNDAIEAKDNALFALRRIILDTTRPNLDHKDEVTDRVQTLGVLRDKLTALSLIVTPTEHPIYRGRLTSPYSSSDQIVPELLASLLSNTVKVSDADTQPVPYYRIGQFDISLRRKALDLLKEEVIVVGRHPEASELLVLRSAEPKETAPNRDPDWDRLSRSRDIFKEFYRTLIGEELQQQQQRSAIGFDFSFAELTPFEQSRNEFELAYTRLGDDRLYMAPVTTSDGTTSATGLLIRNNLNVAEDYLAAVTKTQDQINEGLFAKKKKSIGSLGAMPFLDAKQEALHRYIKGEKLFLQEMYQVYTKSLNLP